MKPILATLALLSLPLLPACQSAETPVRPASPATPAVAARAAPSASSVSPAAAGPAVLPVPPRPAPAAAGPERRSDGRRVETFGAFTGRPGLVNLAAVLEGPEKFAGQELAVSAKVRRACRKKGCWMEVAPSLDPGAQGARVAFKDYGFFVPLDSAGSDAKVEGVLSVKKLEKTAVAHLEAEGARFQKKHADGSAHEVQLVATGVELTRP